MKKHAILIAIALAVAAYLAWRWWSNRKSASGDSVAPGGSTDLNSVAPELIGGSSGPNVGPAVSLPVNITLTEQANTAPKPKVEDDDDDMQSGKRIIGSPVHRQRLGAPGPPRGLNMPADDEGDMQEAGISTPDENGNPNGGY